MSFERRPGPGAGSVSGLKPGSRLGSLGTAGVILAALLLAGMWAAWHLRLEPGQLAPGQGGWQLAGEFFGRALSPAWQFQGSYQGSGADSLPVQALRAAGTTVIFAATSLFLSSYPKCI